MNVTTLGLLEKVRTSFWFIPSGMVLGAAALSVVGIHVDNAIRGKVIEKLGWFYAGGPEGARAVLAAIAGSMITVAGVVFSITVVLLSLASQQFGPRILRTFIRDRSNQVVLGSFVATFVYCLLVLRTVRGTQSTDFVPYISVTFGILLAVASIGVLIFFVHYAAESIQASSLIAAVGRELEGAIDSLYPDQIGSGDGEGAEPKFQFAGTETAVPSLETGYVQFIDGDELLKLAVEHSLVIEVAANPGDFVRTGDSLVRIEPGRGLDDKVCGALRGTFGLGERRTATQDIDFLFRQLTEIAVRALSPGINDPFTAIECLDRLSAALSRLAGRTIPSGHRRDEQGHIRVITRPVTFAEMARTSLGSVRRYGETHEMVISRLMEAIRDMAPFIRRDEDRDALAEEARHALDASARWSDEWSRRRIEREYQAVFTAFTHEPV